MFVFLIFILPIGLIQGEETYANDVYQFGVSYSTIGERNSEIFAPLKTWTASLSGESEQGLHTEIHLKMCSPQELKDLYSLNKIDGLWLTVPEMLDIGIIPDVVFIGDEVRYVIIVHEQGNTASLSDLAKGKTLMAIENEKMVLAIPWLEMLLTRNKNEKERVEYKAQTTVEKSSNAIFKIFFQKADAAIITKATFELACEQNSQLPKKLKVLAESPPFITSFFLFRPSLSKDPKIKRMEKAILNIHKTVGGRQLMKILKINKVRKYPSAIMGETIQFLKEYERITRQ